MSLFISERIRKQEFGKLIPAADKAVLLAGSRPELALLSLLVFTLARRRFLKA